MRKSPHLKDFKKNQDGTYMPRNIEKIMNKVQITNRVKICLSKQRVCAFIGEDLWEGVNMLL